MKNLISRLSLISSLVVISVLGACTQLPTEKQGVSDIRPQISFKAGNAVQAARVLVDGLDMGAVGNYQDGVAALKILPGMHLLQVNAFGRTILEEKFYAGEGVNRTFNVK